MCFQAWFCFLSFSSFEDKFDKHLFCTLNLEPDRQGEFFLVCLKTTTMKILLVKCFSFTWGAAIVLNLLFPFHAWCGIAMIWPLMMNSIPPFHWSLFSSGLQEILNIQIAMSNKKKKEIKTWSAEFNEGAYPSIPLILYFHFIWNFVFFYSSKWGKIRWNFLLEIKICFLNSLL